MFANCQSQPKLQVQLEFELALFSFDPARFNRARVVRKSQAHLQVFLGLGPYTDATLQNHVCRWCGRVFRKLMGNQFHAADDHPVEFQRLGSLQSNLLHHH